MIAPALEPAGALETLRMAERTPLFEGFYPSSLDGRPTQEAEEDD